MMNGLGFLWASEGMWMVSPGFSAEGVYDYFDVTLGGCDVYL